MSPRSTTAEGWAGGTGKFDGVDGHRGELSCRIAVRRAAPGNRGAGVGKQPAAWMAVRSRAEPRAAPRYPRRQGRDRHVEQRLRGLAGETSLRAPGASDDARRPDRAGRRSRRCHSVRAEPVPRRSAARELLGLERVAADPIRRAGPTHSCSPWAARVPGCPHVRASAAASNATASGAAMCLVHRQPLAVPTCRLGT
jgi:hypothetical protein